MSQFSPQFDWQINYNKLCLAHKLENRTRFLVLVLRWTLPDRGLVLSAVYARAVAGLFQNF